MKAPYENNLELARLKIAYGLTMQEIGDATRRCLSAVGKWLAKPNQPHYTMMPDSALRLLEFELGLSRASFTRARLAKRRTERYMHKLEDLHGEAM